MPLPILIVDDSAVVRAFHAYILRSAGFEVVEAENGFTALERLHAIPCALAIVDVNMPHMDGFTLIREIRANAPTRSLPVIVVSTEQEAEDKRMGFDAGADVYVVKPTQPDELMEHVRTLMARVAAPTPLGARRSRLAPLAS
ncbi:MAG TPA: response regulator [Gemmatimonadaceae bacterium]|nr:response regulator [Gemmatimonadaceae bacterium]